MEISTVQSGYVKSIVYVVLGTSFSDVGRIHGAEAGEGRREAQTKGKQ